MICMGIPSGQGERNCSACRIFLPSRQAFEIHMETEEHQINRAKQFKFTEGTATLPRTKVEKEQGSTHKADLALS